MAIYTNIKDIPYPFLHDACMLIDRYTEGVNRIRVTDKGEVCVTVKGMLDDRKTLQRIMFDLDPDVTGDSSLEDYKPEICEDYDWSHSYDETYIYTKENIDYRNL